MRRALVIGAGPAGLMAAEMLGRSGADVMIADARPSPARKFLMAGKSGLNLTRAEPFETFLRAFGDAAPHLRPMLENFGPHEVQNWAQGLGQDLFTGSTGRVFPRAMKASPLLRAWLGRLATLNIRLETRWIWRGWQGDAFVFDTPSGVQTIASDVAVLACGGASWARLGSDGRWIKWVGQTSPFQPANAGLSVTWSRHMAPCFGAPIKGVAWRAGSIVSRGECILSERGLEGGGIYSLTPALREGAGLTVDLLPDLNHSSVRDRLTRRKAKQSLTNHLRKVLGLTGVKLALLHEFARPLPDDLTSVIKALPISYDGLRPIDEAISTAGGLRFDALDEDLMIRERPGVFASGEMLDWEAPTGGYLLTASLATGRWAGLAAAKRLGSGSLNAG